MAIAGYGYSYEARDERVHCSNGRFNSYGSGFPICVLKRTAKETFLNAGGARTPLILYDFKVVLNRKNIGNTVRANIDEVLVAFVGDHALQANVSVTHDDVNGR
jgi:hypothetical protein